MNRKIKTILITIIFLCATSGFCLSEQLFPPPIYPGSDNVPDGSINKMPVTVLTLGNYYIRLEITLLVDVKNRIKSGVIQHQGDASEYVQWLCYTIPDGLESQRIWIASSEMGGGKVDVVIAERISDTLNINKYCPVLPNIYRPVKMDRNIWLGTKIEELDNSLGKPLFERGGLRIYDYFGKKTLPDKESADNVVTMVDYDEISSLAVKVKDGKIIILWASKGTSY